MNSKKTKNLVSLSKTCSVVSLKHLLFRLSKRAHLSNVQRGFRLSAYSVMTSQELYIVLYSSISQLCLS